MTEFEIYEHRIRAEFMAANPQMNDGVIDNLVGIALKALRDPTLLSPGMTPEKYIQAALRTEMKFEAYQLIPERLRDVNAARMLHAVMGLVTEAGEMMDALKKYLIYGKPLDYINLVEEIGDSQWYTALAVQTCGEVVPGATWESILARNIAKLKARYPDKFTEEHALNRDLAAERKTLEQP